MAINWSRSIKLGKIINLKTITISLGCILFIWLIAAFVLDHRMFFLPGITSPGHLLFEESCGSCHEGFKPVSNETCLRCHQAEMAVDAHGIKKFRDPRWAELMEKIDVLTCTACHNEHVHIFRRGVHLPSNLCMTCHQGIIEGELQSHNGFAPSGCWAAGCHNFHDHRSISTGFLRQNLDQPAMLSIQEVLERTVKTKLELSPVPDLMQEFLGGES